MTAWRRMMDSTVAHYDRAAERFWAGTRDHDVSQNIQALLEAIEGNPPFAILDFGCGPGRDLAHFRALGHEAVGLEGSKEFAAMARTHSGCEVLRQDFLALRLPPGRFHGQLTARCSAVTAASAGKSAEYGWPLFRCVNSLMMWRPISAFWPSRMLM